MSEIIQIMGILYLFIINGAAFFAFKTDKKLSQTHHRRISERTLLLLALLGGSVGAEFGMQLFRHKTRKPLFQIGIPLLIILHVFLFKLITQH
ncbi:DUF1294 domain-containing protein [Allofustis seminis]|uniref:DUF1294 domain-containing protein n=1 Tax=Allofustis seminis TaxID=166939 RepID=UPI00035DE94C|nr:DUF1294 domain-containing protein [Allofustis seminis]